MSWVIKAAPLPLVSDEDWENRYSLRVGDRVYYKGSTVIGTVTDIINENVFVVKWDELPDVFSYYGADLEPMR